MVDLELTSLGNNWSITAAARYVTFHALWIILVNTDNIVLELTSDLRHVLFHVLFAVDFMWTQSFYTLPLHMPTFAAATESRSWGSQYLTID